MGSHPPSVSSLKLNNLQGGPLLAISRAITPISRVITPFTYFVRPFIGIITPLTTIRGQPCKDLKNGEKGR